MAEAKSYTGFEREQRFVERYEKNPAWNGKSDKRQERVREEWAWLCRRHKEHWTSEDDQFRSVPTTYRQEGKVGWFFPKCWIEEFAASRRQRAA